MIEALLTTGSKAAFMANSGPGPKTLIAGDTTLGYFGEVTDTQLFTPAQIASMSGFTLGTDNATVPGPGSNLWLKFVWNGKFIFIAKMPFRTNISWADLYAAGLVYGTRDNGKYPQTPAVHQYIQMPKVEGSRTWTLKPRLPTGYGTDPTPGGTLTTGEWNQLFGRCVADANGGLGAPNFASFTYAQTGISPGNTLDTIVQETLNSNVTTGFIRGEGTTGVPVNAARAALKTDRASGGTNVHGWRPVLELVPDTEGKDPYNLRYQTLGNFTPIINEMRQAPLDSGKRPGSPRAQTWPYGFPQVAYSFVNATTRVNRIKGTTESPTLKAFTITGSYVA